jgi:hypothetical protein
LVLEKFLKEQLVDQQNANTKKKKKKKKQENKIDVGYEVKWHQKIDQHISKMQRKQTKHKQRQKKEKEKNMNEKCIKECNITKIIIEL